MWRRAFQRIAIIANAVSTVFDKRDFFCGKSLEFIHERVELSVEPFGFER